jgi:hypothetical protein
MYQTRGLRWAAAISALWMLCIVAINTMHIQSVEYAAHGSAN